MGWGWGSKGWGWGCGWEGLGQKSGLFWAYLHSRLNHKWERGGEGTVTGFIRMREGGPLPREPPLGPLQRLSARPSGTHGAHGARHQGSRLLGPCCGKAVGTSSACAKGGVRPPGSQPRRPFTAGALVTHGTGPQGTHPWAHPWAHAVDPQVTERNTGTTRRDDGCVRQSGTTPVDPATVHVTAAFPNAHAMPASTIVRATPTATTGTSGSKPNQMHRLEEVDGAQGWKVEDQRRSGELHSEGVTHSARPGDPVSGPHLH